MSAFTDFAPTRLERPRPSADGRGVVFEYVLGEPTARVQLAVYDVRGRLMFQTDPERQSAGTFTVAWRGESRAGAAAARGVYVVRLRTASALRSHKFAYLRP